MKVKRHTRLQGLFWAPVALALEFLGAASVNVARGRRVSLSGRPLARHLAAVFTTGAFLYSCLFLYAERLIAVVFALFGLHYDGLTLNARAPYMVDSLGSALLVDCIFLAIVAMVAAVIYSAVKELSFKRGLHRVFGRGRCPKCKKRLGWFRALSGLGACLQGLSECRHCGTIIDRTGKRAIYPREINLGAVRMRLGVVAICVVVAFSSGVVAGWGFWLGAGYLRLEMVKRAMAKDGYSLALPPEQLKEPEPTNAVYWLARAEKLVDKNLGSQYEFILSFRDAAKRGELTEEQCSRGREIVETHAQALNFLKQAAKQKIVVWPLKRLAGTPFSEVQSFAGYIVVGRLAAMQAILDAREGRSDGALAAVGSGLAATRAIAKSEDTIARMASNGIYRILLNGVETVLPDVPAARAQVLWADLLEPDELKRQYVRSAVFESIAMVELMKWESLDQWYVAAGQKASLWTWAASLLTAPQVLWMVSSDLISIHARLNLFLKPYWEAKPALARVERMARLRAWIFGSNYPPTYFRAYQSVMRLVARMHLARAAIAVQQCREESGHWPQHLRECRPSKSGKYVDVFTGDWLKIIPAGTGAKVYSVGPDGVDNGGEPFDRKTHKGDLVWGLK